ncbi:hypothetical protein [Natrinema halophilum]|uniref:Uncharacterized protein n=1 Tax=Natrinema halophilum TaxID=1699371 RepID=A0A7D5KM15_9EURY|nr:hypothetical protein [Natrinema halophilum]QLG50438.1 hypothetical protein HYG82_17080 [Natrinema halophilum]
MSPDDVSVTSQGVDYYDDIAVFEVSNDGDQAVTLTYTNESGTESTVTVDANSATNVTTGVTGNTAGEITLTKDGTTYAHDFAGHPVDLGPANPNPGKITIEAVSYDEQHGLVEYTVSNGNDRPVDGHISHVPVGAENSNLTISPDGSTTILVEDNESRVGDIYRTTSALQLDFFEDVEDTMEPGDPVPLLSSGEVTDETPRKTLEQTDSANSDRSSASSDGNEDASDDGSSGDDGPDDSSGDDGSDDSSGDDGSDDSSGDDGSDDSSGDDGSDDSSGDDVFGNESAADDDSASNESAADDDTSGGDSTASDDTTNTDDGASTDSSSDSETDSTSSEGTPGFTAGTALAGGMISLEWIRRRARAGE